MPTKEGIDNKYLRQANQLEAEYFNIVDEGLPSQHRVLKTGKQLANFDLAHGDIWKAHEAELIAEGLMQPPPIPEPIRNLEAEIDSLKVRIEKLEKKP